MILSPEEIHQVTGRKRHRAQALVLARMSVPFVVRPDGRPIVSRIAFERTLGDDSRREPKAEPDFSKLDS